MKSRIFILSILTLLVLHWPIFAQEPVIRRSAVVEQYKGNPYYLHFVKSGETITAITKAYNVSKNELIAENPFLQEGLKVDQVLRIPKREVEEITPEPEPSAKSEIAKPSVISEKTYVVKKKETLYGIFKQFNITVEDLLRANPGITALQEGMELKIPSSSADKNTDPIIPAQNTVLNKTIDSDDKDYEMIKVEPGQTAYSLSKANNITVEQFYTLNPDAREGLKVDQLVKIPRSDNRLVNKVAEQEKLNNEQIEKIEGNKTERILNTRKSVSGIIPDSCINLTNRNRTYHIAFLLPLALEESDSILVQTEDNAKPLTEFKTFDYFQFYCGLKMAADSLGKIGFNAKIHVYDADSETDSLKIKKVLYKNELASMDLVIGPLFVKSFEVASRYSNKHKMNMVNPLSRRDRIVEGNPFVIKAQPSEVAIADEIASFVSKKYKDDNIVIIRNGVKELSILYESLIAGLQGGGEIPATKMRRVNYQTDGFQGVTKALAPDKKNVVIMLSANRSHIPNFVSLLHNYGKGKDITLIGVPGWENLDIESEFLEKLDFHQVTTSYVNYEDENVKLFVKQFRLLYNTEPEVDKQAFLGYDLGWYFFQALMNFGPDFSNCLPAFKMDGLQYDFDFSRDSTTDGFQNYSCKIIRIKDYKWIEAE
ncbi:MAG: LysM peptidoglycan-binding domain-containing protein [Bacteroidales bacterium]|nr:LysM peptidoglycan-binding domain-containing protein [Bacteroidales bacterium]